MKNFFTLFGLAALLLTSCDVINEEDRFKNAVLPPPAEPVRRVLIEDFTGHRCKNCPKASKEIKALDSLFPGRIVAIAIHAGPSNFTGTTVDYPTDWTTPFGNDWATFYDVNFQPVGMVSRRDWTATGSSHLKLYPGWAEESNNIFALDPAIELGITGNFNATSGQISGSVEGEFLLNGTSDLKVMVVLTESKIIDNQLMPDDTRNPSYEHNHVFRTSFTGSWGEDFFSGAHDTTTTASFAFTGNVNPNWNSNNCHVIAYVFNPTTFEVMQAIEVALADL